MGEIATEQETYNIGRVGTPTPNECCTKMRAEVLGCNVSGSYSTNQLVQYEDLSPIISEVEIELFNEPDGYTSCGGYAIFGTLDGSIEVEVHIPWLGFTANANLFFKEGLAIIHTGNLMFDDDIGSKGVLSLSLDGGNSYIDVDTIYGGSCIGGSCLLRLSDIKDRRIIFRATPD